MNAPVAVLDVSAFVRHCESHLESFEGAVINIKKEEKDTRQAIHTPDGFRSLQRAFVAVAWREGSGKEDGQAAGMSQPRGRHSLGREKGVRSAGDSQRCSCFSPPPLFFFFFFFNPPVAKIDYGERRKTTFSNDDPVARREALVRRTFPHRRVLFYCVR